MSASPPESPAVDITFVRLADVPIAEVVALLNDARTHRHLPLAGAFSEDAAEGWVRAKDGQWDAHGYGPWAILVNGGFAGWGGFQKEEGGAAYALVLRPEHWGRGAAITRLALARGFGALGLDEVTIALPQTRNSARVVSRWGFRADGEASYGGASFQQFRLTRDDWHRRTGSAG